MQMKSVLTSLLSVLIFSAPVFAQVQTSSADEIPYDSQTPQAVKDRFQYCRSVEIVNSSNVTVRDVIDQQARMDFAECHRFSDELQIGVLPWAPNLYTLDSRGILRMTYTVRVVVANCSEVRGYEDYKVVIESLLNSPNDIACNYIEFR